MVGHAVVLDHRAVAVRTAVQAFSLAVGRVRGAVDAVRAMPLASWSEGLNRITCSSTLGGSQSVSAPRAQGYPG